jgi:hypothetical protein
MSHQVLTQARGRLLTLWPPLWPPGWHWSRQPRGPLQQRYAQLVLAEKPSQTLSIFNLFALRNSYVGWVDSLG